MDFAAVGTIIHYGGGSAKQLNYKRDLLLSDATARLHYKHNGWLSAFVVSLMILAFHALRAVYWSVVNLINPSTRAKQKATKYLKLLGANGTVWPRNSTTRYDARS